MTKLFDVPTPRIEACYIRLPIFRSEEGRIRYEMALMRELELFEHKDKQKHRLAAIFIGGRGARFLSQQGYLDTAGILNKKFHGTEAQVTVEIIITAQVDLESSFVQIAGVNRVVCDPRWLWRVPLRDRPEQIRLLGEWVKERAQEGKLVALDLEIGRWPEYAWKEFVEIVCGWPVHHLSIYFADSSAGVPSADRSADLFLWSFAALAQEGFTWQGTYDFARGVPSAWTAIYAERRSYRGFGVGAWSYEDGRYWGNARQTQRYCSLLAQGLTPRVEQVIESVHEHLAKGLSRGGGISLKEMRQILGKQQCLEDAVERLMQNGYLSSDKGERFSFTPAGFLLENGVVIQLVNGK